MDIDAIVKVGALAAAMLALPKIWQETQGIRFAHRKGSYELARDFIQLVENDGHPLLIEMGYRSLYKSTRVSAPEIVYLLSLPRPSNALSLYTRGKRFLEFTDTVSDQHPRVRFHRNFSRKSIRTLHRVFFLSTYVIFFFIAAAPIIFVHDQIGAINPSFTFSAVCIGANFGFLAFLSLMQFANNLAAERFIKLQASAV